MTKEDNHADIEMSFKQIISMADFICCIIFIL